MRQTSGASRPRTTVALDPQNASTPVRVPPASYGLRGGLSCLPGVIPGGRLCGDCHTRLRPAPDRLLDGGLTGQIGISPRGSGPTPGPQPEVSRHRTGRPRAGRGDGRTDPSAVDFDPGSPGCLEETETRDRPGRGSGIADWRRSDRWPELRLARRTAARRQSGEGVKRSRRPPMFRVSEVSGGTCGDRR